MPTVATNTRPIETFRSKEKPIKTKTTQIISQKENSDRLFAIYKKLTYFDLLAAITYFSSAIVMDGVSGVGAKISTRNP